MRIIHFADNDFLPTALVRNHRNYSIHRVSSASPGGALIRHPKRRFFDANIHPKKTVVVRDETGNFPTTTEDEIECLVRETIEEITGQLPVEGLWLALPAVSDNERRLHYRKILARAVGQARSAIEPRFYYEADAVVQYFRLVRREIATATDELQTYLVIDAGAGTTNLAVTFKPRTRHASLGKEGRSRGPLQPVAADAPSPAGAWVDERLRERLLAQLPPDATLSLDAIESAKVEVSRTSRAFNLTANVRSKTITISLTPQHLLDVVGEYWQHLAPTLQELLQSVFTQLQESMYRSDLDRNGVSEPAQVGALFDYVILAGGTSLLPSFDEGLRRLLPGLRATVLRVGSDYSYAVAAGLAAHYMELAASVPPAASSSPTALPVQTSESWAHRVADSSVAGVARLLNDVAVVYQAKADNDEKSTILTKTVVHAKNFPLAYEEPVVVDWQFQKIRHASKFTLGAKYTSDNATPGGTKGPEPSPDEFFVLASGVDSRWKRLKDRLPSHVRLRTEYVESNLSVSIDVLRGAEPSAPGQRVENIEIYLDSPEDERRRARAKLEKWTTSKRPTAPVTVCVDFGTSKTVAVMAIPGFDLEGRSDVSEQDSLGPDLPSNDREVDGSPEAVLSKPAELEPAPVTTPATSNGPGIDVPPQYESRIEPIHRQPLQGTGGPQNADASAAFDRLVGLVQPVPHPSSTEHLVQDESELLSQIHHRVAGAGLAVQKADILNIYLSLKVGPLVALAGPPGMGKSSIARYLLQALGLTERLGTLARVAVEARWTDFSHLMAGGEPHIDRLGDFARIVYRASKRQSELFGVILDEWNLAHVDYYLSHVVSALSDDCTLPLASHPNGAIVNVPLRAPAHRLLILSTMNVDEAATMLTEKVLDRTSVIEFLPRKAPEQLTTTVGESQPHSDDRLTADAWRQVCLLPESLAISPQVRKLWDILAGVETANVSGLATSRTFSLGYRATRDIAAYLHFAQQLTPRCGLELPEGWALDRQVLQRVLPRLHGDDRVRGTLEALRTFCQAEQLPDSLVRVDRMLRTLDDEHSTSFWVS